MAFRGCWSRAKTEIATCKSVCLLLQMPFIVLHVYPSTTNDWFTVLGLASTSTRERGVLIQLNSLYLRHMLN
jgi:hypothetical protein